MGNAFSCTSAPGPSPSKSSKPFTPPVIAPGTSPSRVSKPISPPITITASADTALAGKAEPSLSPLSRGTNGSVRRPGLPPPPPPLPPASDDSTSQVPILQGRADNQKAPPLPVKVPLSGSGQVMTSARFFRTSFSRQPPAADSPERSQVSGWKFWRKLSTRRTEKKPRAATRPGADTGGPLGLWPRGDGDGLLVTSGSLPDVVDKTVVRRSNSLKAPPKPPRLFLFRSSSINHPRSSLDGGSERSSLVGGVEEGGGCGVDVVPDTEPIYVNSAFGAGLQTGLCANDRVIPPTVYSNNNNNDGVIPPTVYNNNNNSVQKDVMCVAQAACSMDSHHTDTFDKVQDQRPLQTLTGTLPRNHKPFSSASTTATTAGVASSTHYHTLPSNGRHKQSKLRMKSAERDGGRRGARHRLKSSERELTGHSLVLQSAMDLLCQRLVPGPLLEPLLARGVLCPGDVQAFQGHPDRRLVCESLAGVVGAGSYEHFRAFIDVLQHSEGHEEIARVLAAMRDVDHVVHHVISQAPEDPEHEVLADERTVRYELGYLAGDGLTLRPLVELERARPADRRTTRGSRISAMMADSGSNNSSMTSLPGSSGPVMLTACITGHNLSGPRALALADVIKQHECLLELRMGKTGLGGGDVAVLCEALTHNTTLVSLDVRLNTLDLTAARALADLLRHTRALRQLNVSSSGLEAAGSRVILAALTSNRTLCELDMSFLDVGDVVCDVVRDVLKANSTLTKLRLRSNNFSAAGCLVLAEGLGRNRTLLELDLSRNCVGDGGLEALARFVPDSSITDLSLENCGLTAAGCDALAAMISGGRRLRSVDLSVNLLGDVGVVRLAPCLERSSVLQTVGLNMCGVTNDGFCRLLDVLEKNASISLLKLCYNRLGKDFTNPAATSDNLRYRLRIVTSSKPKLKILLWGNAFDDV